LNQESKELDNLISKFASSANTLQQAYHSLENEMLDSLNSKEFVSVKNETEISNSSIWEFRKNLIHILEMIDQPVLILNQSLKIITQNNSAKAIYQISEKDIKTELIFPKDSRTTLENFLNNGIESKIESLRIKTPVTDLMKFEIRRHIDNFTKSPLISVACIDERLLQSDQVKGKLQMQNMIANLAHNIRTPMSAIMGYAQLLQRDLGGNEKYTEKIDFIFDGVQRIERVISSLINYANEPAIIKEPEYSLNKYIEQKTMIWSQDFGKIINLKFQSKHSIDVKTTINKRGLDSILQNLILNSCEATNEKELDICIDVRNKNNSIYIKLTDFGEGISKENLEKCMEPFFTTRINGLGLGLSIVENLVMIMNGTIKIKSDIGYGTQVKLNFPE
tara:strand:- start:132 stop:1307 length:1176 start_codon:yes stop_codon:yes gene_type:complete